MYVLFIGDGGVGCMFFALQSDGVGVCALH